MAISRIASQDAKGTVAGAQSVSAVYPATPTQGNLLVATGQANDSGGGDITISGWNIADRQPVGVSSGSDVAVFWKIAGAAEPTTVTLTMVDAANPMRLHIYEFTGNAGAGSVFIGVGHSIGPSTNVTSQGTGSIAVSAGDLVLVVVGVSVTVTLPAWDSGFTLLQSDAAIRLFDGSLLPGADGTYSATGSWTTGSKATGLAIGFRALPTAQISSDSGTLVGAESLLVQSSDSGSASEAQIITATTSSVDVGALVETSPVSASGTDTATGTEAQSATATATTVEAGGGVDTGSIGMATSETGAGGDTSALSVALTLSDSAVVTDAGYTVRISTTDLGTGNESFASTSVLTGADAGAGAEISKIDLSGIEAGVSVDAGSTAASSASSDPGVATDSALSVATTSSQVGALADTQSTVQAFASSDVASGSESSTGPVVSSTEAGTGTQAATTTASSSSIDTATGTEVPVVKLSAVDSAVVVEGTAAASAISGSDFGASSESVALLRVSTSEAGTSTEGAGIALSSFNTSVAADAQSVFLLLSDTAFLVESLGPIVALIAAVDAGLLSEGEIKGSVLSSSDMALAADSQTLGALSLSADAAALSELYSLFAGVSVSEPATIGDRLTGIALTSTDIFHFGEDIPPVSTDSLLMVQDRVQTMREASWVIVTHKIPIR